MAAASAGKSVTSTIIGISAMAAMAWREKRNNVASAMAAAAKINISLANGEKARHLKSPKTGENNQRRKYQNQAKNQRRMKMAAVEKR